MRKAVTVLKAYAAVPSPTTMRTMVNSRPGVESGCTSPNPTDATVITVR
jgi:hypothetical protein